MIWTVFVVDLDSILQDNCVYLKMKYKIYTLEHPITGEIRYVGFTSRKYLQERYRVHIHSATHNRETTYSSNWIKSLLKQGLKPVIKLLDETENEKEWQLLEQYWICQMRTWGFKLTNLTQGGEGTPGYVSPKETRQHLFKPVLQYTLEGNFVKEYETLAMVTRDLGFGGSSGSSVIKAIRSDGCSYGFRWRYKTNDYPLSIGKVTLKMCKVNVDQFSLKGEFIQKWKSVAEAAKQLQICSANITRSIKNDKTCGGFRWKYSHEEKSLSNKKFTPQFYGKPVLLINSEGVVLKKYATSREVLKDFNVSFQLVSKILTSHIKKSKMFNGNTLKFEEGSTC